MAISAPTAVEDVSVVDSPELKPGELWALTAKERLPQQQQTTSSASRLLCVLGPTADVKTGRTLNDSLSLKVKDSLGGPVEVPGQNRPCHVIHLQDSLVDFLRKKPRFPYTSPPSAINMASGRDAKRRVPSILLRCFAAVSLLSGAVAQSICAGKQDGIACINPTTFTICNGGRPSVAQPCAAGTVCCRGACVFPTDAACGIASSSAPAQKAPSTSSGQNSPLSTSAPKASGTTAAPKSPSTSVPAAPPAPPPAPKSGPGGTLCVGVTDGQIACTGELTFNICVNGVFAQAVDQSCAPGTKCCNSLRICIGTNSVCPPSTVAPPAPASTGAPQAPLTAGPAPPAATTAPAAPPSFGPGNCATILDNRITCTSKDTFKICKGGVPDPAQLTCQPGLECCEGASACVFPGQCSVNPPALTASCVGIPDNQISCTSSTTFNICVNGAFARAVDQRCVAGTICCTSLNRCINPGENCPALTPAPTTTAPPAPVTTAPASCAGIADGKISCLSSTTFNICQNGVFAPALPQSCQPGLECCTAANACLWPGQCAQIAASGGATTTVATVPPQNNQNILPPASCTGIANGRISCLSRTLFNVCENGVFANALPQSCPAGLECCTASSSCVWPGTCASPVQGPGLVASCQGIANGRISCLSSTTFNICENGVFANAVPQSCPATTVCCTARNACVYPGECPINNALPPPPAGPTCAGVQPGKIVCLTQTTFNICDNNGAFAQAVPQSCSAGLVCCGSTSRCENPGSCPGPVGPTPPGVPPPAPPALPPPTPASCAGVKDNNIVCLTSTTFNICTNGGFANAVPQSCAPGTECCTALSICVLPGTCPIPGALPPPPVAPVSPPSCAGKPDGQVVCLSDRTFNLCVNSGFAQAVPQSCAPGTVCCASKNGCVFPGDCGAAPVLPPPAQPPVQPPPAPVSPPATVSRAPPAGQTPIVPPVTPPAAGSCAGIAEGGLVCRSTNTFNYCKNNALVWAVDQSCATGTACCQTLGVCTWPGTCPVAGAVPPPPAPASCANVLPGSIVCLSSTTFNICAANGSFGSATPQTCSTGLVCCPTTNGCVQPSFCPSQGVQALAAEETDNARLGDPGDCSGIADNKIACIDSRRFNICTGGAAAVGGTQSCAAGTECCTNANACVAPGTCSLYAPPPPTPPAPVNPTNFCRNIADGRIACISDRQFQICKNSSYTGTTAQTCAPGTVCCTATSTCTFPGTCPVAGTLLQSVAALDTSSSETANVPAPGPVNVGCAGIPDGDMYCLTTTTFHTCVRGAFSAAIPFTCPTGTVCCAALKACVLPGSCPIAGAPVTNPLPCKDKPSGTIECIGNNQFNICNNGVFERAVPQSCAPGTTCCSSANGCITAGTPCPTLAPPTNLCQGAADNTMKCLSKSSFQLCANGAYASATPFSCQAGLECCESLRSCVFAGQCPARPLAVASSDVVVSSTSDSSVGISGASDGLVTVSNTGTCTGKADNSIACLSSSAFNICWKGAFANAVPQTCATGLLCCESLNRCSYANECPATSPPTPPPAPAPAPTGVAPPPAPAPAPPATCPATPGSSLKCLTATTFNYCVDGAFVNAVPQSCPGTTVCCESTQSCVFPGSCPVPGGSPPPNNPTSCVGVADGRLACLSTSTFNYCQNGAFVNALPQSCPIGTVCCQALSVCANPGTCPAVGSSPPSQNPSLPINAPPVPPTCAGAANNQINPGTETCASANLPAPSTTSAAAPAPTQTTIPASWANTAPGSIVCFSDSTFNICNVGGKFANAPAQPCPAGLVCCTAKNACVFPGGCPVPNQFIQPPAINPASCAGVPDGRISCLSRTQFNVCQNGLFANALPQTCQAGLECCSQANACVWPGQCGSTPTYPGPAPAPPAPTATPGISDGSCTNIRDGNISCLSKTTFNICQNGLFVNALPQSCYPGLECCTYANACVWPGTCPTPPPPVTTTSTTSTSSAAASSTSSTSSSLSTFFASNPGDAQGTLTGTDTATWTSTTWSSSVGTSSHSTFFASNRGDAQSTLTETDTATWTSTTWSSSVGTSTTSTSSAIQTPPPVLPFDTNVCTGTANDKIGCASTTTFNVCLNSNPFPSASAIQSCSAGLVCCASTNSCEWVSSCPATVARRCEGVPDRSVVCTSSTTYNICLGGLFFAKARDTACPSGYECCAAKNGCVPTGTCSGTPTSSTTATPTASSTSPPGPNPPNPQPPAVIPIVDRNVCLGTQNNKIACTGASKFNVCSNSALDTSADQACPAGLVCCAATNTCDYASACPVTSRRLCNGVPNNGAVCTGDYTYNICLEGQVFAKAVDSVCPPNYQCCANFGGCVPLGQCAPPVAPPPPVNPPVTPPTPPTPPPLTVDTNACTGAPVNGIGCTGPSSFNQCANGVFAKAVDTACPAGTECCPLYGGCVRTGLCRPPSVQVSSTSLVRRDDGDGLISLPPLIDDDELNNLPRYPGAVLNTDPCLGTAAGKPACTSKTRFNICNSQGTFDTVFDQSCGPSGDPLDPLVCCASTGRCEFSKDCPAVALNLCAGIADNAAKCTSATTYNICKGGVFVKAVDTQCPTGTECCAAANGCVATGTCNLPSPIVRGGTTSATFATWSATTTSSAAAIASSTASTTSSAPTSSAPEPTSTYTASCSGVRDGEIRCKSESTFNFCVGGQFVNANDQRCAPGTICCLSTQKCDFYYNCPGYKTTPTGECAGKNDGETACTGPTTFNFCYYQAFAIAQPQSCPRGLVCCPSQRLCNYPGSCTFTGPRNPNAAPPKTCVGAPDGDTVCTGVNTINFCVNGAIIRDTASQLCAPGTVCCAATGRCDWAFNCPAVGPVDGTVRPPSPTAPATNSCAGKPDNTPVCTGPFSFNVCIAGALITNTPDQNCPQGTVCCLANGRCDYATACGTVPVAPGPGTTPIVGPGAGPITQVSCNGRADGLPVCTGPNSFNYCLNNRVIPFTADQPCPPGTVCCAATGLCNRPGSCEVASRPPAADTGTSTRPAPTAAPVTNPCVGKDDGAVVCVSETSINYCKSGQIWPNTPAQPCPGGTVCCPSSALCVTRDTPCAQPFRPPVATQASEPDTSVRVESEVVPFVPRSCVNIPNGTPVCTGDLTFNLCLNGLIVVNTPDQYCAGGTVCCGILRTCTRASDCPKPNPCSSKADGSLVCTSQNTFNLCTFGNLANAPDQTCAAGTVCCPASGTCDRVENCKAITPSPSPSPSPSVRPVYGDCAGKPDGTGVCTGPMSINTCTNGKVRDEPSQPCALGTVCCASTGKCEINCPGVVSPPAPSPSPSPSPKGTASAPVVVPLPTAIAPIISANCTGKGDYERACSGDASFVYCRGGVPIPNQAINACPANTICCKASNTCLTKSACDSYVAPPVQTSTPPGTPGGNICAGRPNGATICNGDNTFAVCQKGEINAVQACASGTICCKKSQSCDFKDACDRIDVPYVPPSSKCYGVLDGFSVCSNDLSQVFTCRSGGISSTATCPSGQACCRKTASCQPIGQCPDVCLQKNDGDLACLSANQFTTCKGGVSDNAIVTCAGGTICCETKNACTWPNDCY
ncbi:hypothetical protein HDU96_002324 [Phlyctochytrium bullatum]|nr:hypothetical protein HDU96_002324 [Phlyctochytrium bullatum]